MKYIFLYDGEISSLLEKGFKESLTEKTSVFGHFYELHTQNRESESGITVKKSLIMVNIALAEGADRNSLQAGIDELLTLYPGLKLAQVRDAHEEATAFTKVGNIREGECYIYLAPWFVDLLTKESEILARRRVGMMFSESIVPDITTLGEILKGGVEQLTFTRTSVQRRISYQRIAVQIPTLLTRIARISLDIINDLKASYAAQGDFVRDYFLKFEDGALVASGSRAEDAVIENTEYLDVKPKKDPRDMDHFELLIHFTGVSEGWTRKSDNKFIFTGTDGVSVDDMFSYLKEMAIINVAKVYHPASGRDLLVAKDMDMLKLHNTVHTTFEDYQMSQHIAGMGF